MNFDIFGIVGVSAWPSLSGEETWGLEAEMIDHS